MVPTQMLKGILEGCILKVISLNPTYGYEILQELEKVGFNNLSEGTIYPVLLRLEKNSWVNSFYQTSPLGPKRKYYQINPLGLHELNKFEQDYSNLNKIVMNVLSLRKED